MPRYQCPICKLVVETPVPIKGGSCDGNRTHHLVSLHELAVDGTASKIPTNKETAMPKTAKIPSNLCACYSEPVEGKPDTYRSCGRLSGSRFAPGHDAKLKGILIKATVAGSKLTWIDEDGKAGKPFDPEAKAAELGWGKYTDRAKEIEQEKAAAAMKRAAVAAEAKRLHDASKDEAAATKAATKAEADAAKAASKAEAKANPPSKNGNAKVATADLVTIKVGRKTYSGRKVGVDGDKWKVEYIVDGKIVKATVAAAAIVG